MRRHHLVAVPAAGYVLEPVSANVQAAVVLAQVVAAAVRAAAAPDVQVDVRVLVHLAVMVRADQDVQVVVDQLVQNLVG